MIDHKIVIKKRFNVFGSLKHKIERELRFILLDSVLILGSHFRETEHNPSSGFSEFLLNEILRYSFIFGGEYWIGVDIMSKEIVRISAAFEGSNSENIG